MTCACCKKELEPTARVYDVAISRTLASKVDDETHEWDPGFEDYLCEPCLLSGHWCPSMSDRIVEDTSWCADEETTTGQ